MRTLSSTLLSAQQRETSQPYVKVTAVNKTMGVNRYNWSRLYEGSEDDYFHGLVMPGDGSLVRVKITPPADSNKLYWQRVASPGTGSDYNQWTYTGQYGAVVTAVAGLGAEVSVFWIKSNREIRRIKSMDYGATWDSPVLIDYSPSTAINGIAAAYKSNGDLAIFFADQSVLYVKKCLGGAWQPRTAWDKTTGDLSGIGCVYHCDWDLMVTGQDTDGNYKLWSLVYGDGGEINPGIWSPLKELSSAPVGGSFEYRQPFLEKADVFRCYYIEKYTGNEAYSRPYYTCSVPGAGYAENLWREPAPFNLFSSFGLAAAHHGDYAWLSNTNGVWRALENVQSLDITADVISLKQETGKNLGSLTVELRNDDGRYVTPGQGSLSALCNGCQLEISPGYLTGEGAEYSQGQTFCIEWSEHTSGGGMTSMVLHSQDGWGALGDWHAPHQFRWNKAADEASVKDILGVVLARAGLKLDIKSQSAVVSSFFPDFTVNPGDDGKKAILKLLSFVPDRLFIEGYKAYLVYPQSSDAAVYGYGTEHAIEEGKYQQSAMLINRARVEGLDAGGVLVLSERFNWDEAVLFPERQYHLYDRNLNTVADAQQRGDVLLRQAAMAVESGVITVPVNCGQQLYDVIAVTDAPAGLVAAKKRISGITLVYRPRCGEYFQRLEFSGV